MFDTAVVAAAGDVGGDGCGAADDINSAEDLLSLMWSKGMPPFVPLWKS